MIIWQNDFKHSRSWEPVTDDQGVVTGTRVSETGSHSYIVPIDEFTPPKIGEESEIPRLAVSGWNVSLLPDKHYIVSLSYTPKGTPDVPGDEEGNPTDDPSDPGGGEYEMGENRIKVTISTTTNVEPILSYYGLRTTQGASKYPEHEMMMLALYLSGGIEICANGLYKLKSDGDIDGYLSLPECPLTRYILAGYKSINMIQTTLTKSYNSGTVSASKCEKVGKIDDISDMSGVPTEINGYKLDYIKSLYSARKVANNSYQIEEQWLCSYPGGWSKEIYS